MRYSAQVNELQRAGRVPDVPRMALEDPASSLSPYQVANAGTWLEIGEHWRVSAHVSNVFDRRYNTAYYSGPEVGAPFNIAGVNRPREWVLGFSARF
jgi:outer membrane receptor protein involved in Fe transport